MNVKIYYYKALTLWSKIWFRGLENILGLYDYILLRLNINNNSYIFAETTEKINLLFVGKEPNFRILKIIKWLSLSNRFNIILTIHTLSKIDKDIDKYIHTVIRFRNNIHLERIVSNTNIKILIAFTSSPTYAKTAIANFRGKKIFDPYDSWVVYYGTKPHLYWLKKEIKNEFFCYKHADAILARNLEIAESFRMYKIPHSKNIIFPDYCDNEYFCYPQKEQMTPSSSIHLVYSGGFRGKSAKKSSHGIDNFDTLVNNLSSNKIHLHLFPSPSTPVSYYYDYVEEAKQNSFLHLYSSISQKELGQKLSSFTYGILPHFKEKESKILDSKLRYGTSNKFFNFLEAGIPIIISNEMIYMAWLVKRYKIGIVITKSDLINLRTIINKYDYLELQKNVISIRNKLSMKNNIERLINFIMHNSIKK